MTIEEGQEKMRLTILKAIPNISAVRLKYMLWFYRIGFAEGEASQIQKGIDAIKERSGNESE